MSPQRRSPAAPGRATSTTPIIDAHQFTPWHQDRHEPLSHEDRADLAVLAAAAQRGFRCNAAPSHCVPSQLRRRRAAAQRLPALDSGRADPWLPARQPGFAGYEAAAAHLLDHGLLPALNFEGLREMWAAGGESRRAAQAIAERWELVTT